MLKRRQNFSYHSHCCFFSYKSYQTKGKHFLIKFTFIIARKGLREEEFVIEQFACIIIMDR